MVVVLSEATVQHQHTTNARELNRITETARMLGLRVYSLPSEPEDWANIADALAYVPLFDQPQIGIWVGYIPTPAQYTALYQAASAHNIWLINTPEQYQTAMEFDRFYPLLEQLTPASCIITELDQLPTAVASLGLPVFVKGPLNPIKSRVGKPALQRQWPNYIGLANSC